MAFKSLQETIDELVEIPGKVRGEIFLNHADYIGEKEGKGGLRKLEEKMKELGHPVRFKKVNSLEWYSEGLSSAIVVICKEIFFWEEKDIFEMGESAPRFSLGLKVLVQNLVLPERLFEESPVYWENLFDFGEVEPVEYNKELQTAIIRIKGFKTHPLLCVYHAGYLKGLSRLALKDEKITVEEVKCVFKGDPYDEYKIKWQ